MDNPTLAKPHRPAQLDQPSQEELQKTIQGLENENATQHELLKEMLAEMKLLRKRVAELEKQLQDQQNSNGYRHTSSWISKIAFTLQQENRPLRSAELIKLLEKKELMLAKHQSKEQYFSAFLSKAVRYGRVIQQKVKGVRGFYYLLPEWLDEHGTVKPDYRKAML